MAQAFWNRTSEAASVLLPKSFTAKRASITGDKYINGTQLAKALGISRSTLSRRIKAGKLPKPQKSISGMLLFERDMIDRIGEGHMNA